MLPPGVTGDDPALARIGMRYITGREQLIKLAAALPMIPASRAPDVIILDDAGDLLTEAKAQFQRERAICSSTPQYIRSNAMHLNSMQSSKYIFRRLCLVLCCLFTTEVRTACLVYHCPL